MSFLNPLLLFGIAAVSVPIIIHLLNRRKFRKVNWAAMKFVKLSIDQNQRRMRLEEVLHLLLRCALLALLALALARPVMRQSESSFMGQAGVTSVLVLDNSFSMGLEDGEATRFERAKAACTNILDSLPSGSSVALYLGSDVVRPVMVETTALGSAVAAGLAVGVWEGTGDPRLANVTMAEKTFTPVVEAADRDARFKQWMRAVKRSIGWASDADEGADANM